MNESDTKKRGFWKRHPLAKWLLIAWLGSAVVLSVVGEIREAVTPVSRVERLHGRALSVLHTMLESNAHDPSSIRYIGNTGGYAMLPDSGLRYHADFFGSNAYGAQIRTTHWVVLDSAGNVVDCSLYH